jgi:hypothetical protein
MASIISASTTSGTALNMSADTTGVLQFATGATPTTAVTISTAQNVGIGTTNPAAKLVSAGSSSTVYKALILRNGDGTTNSSATIDFEASSGTQGDEASMAGRVSGIRTGSGTSGALAFSTTNAGTLAERMRIDSSGNVNIGQSSAFGAGIRTTIKAADTSSQSLALISAVTSGTGTLQYLVDGSNDVCGFIGINATANTTSYNTSSDYRLKENIVPMTGALDKVQALKPVFWNWKHAPEIIGQGFIAHELQAVIPDAVSGEKDAVDEEGNPKYQGIDTSFLVATLTAAIQEQTIIINDLKARVTALEAK